MRSLATDNQSLDIFMSIDKRHSPKEVKKLLSSAFKKDELDIVGAINDMLVDDFRGFMKSEGYGTFTNDDIRKVFDCTTEQSQLVSKTLTKRLKIMQE
jgi:hypothetical protein